MIEISNLQLTEIEKSTIREHTSRILSHACFSRSDRCKRVLEYIVEHALEHPAEQLKERTIGHEVFHRPANYDTNLDTIVRTTASEIRKRLAQYYQEVGNGGLRIHLSPGGYIPEFHWAPEVQSHPILEPALEPLGRAEGHHPAPVHTAARNRSRYWVRAAIVAVVLAAATAALIWRARSSRFDAFWGDALRSHSVVIGAGPGIRIHGADANEPVHLLSRSIDAVSVQQMESFFSSRAIGFDAKTAEETKFSDLQGKTVVLVGAFDNPWTLDLMNGIPYPFRRDDAAHLQWIGDQKDPGARSWVIPAEPDLRTDHVDFGVIVRMHHPKTGAVIYLVAGLAQQGTEAAGMFATNPSLMNAALDNKVRSDKNVEVVIRTNVHNGVAGQPELLRSTTW